LDGRRVISLLLLALASGRTSTGDPYLRVFLPNGVLTPGQSLDVTLRFRRHAQAPPVSFMLTLLSGQGNP
jgi:hypothetical protein